MPKFNNVIPNVIAGYTNAVADLHLLTKEQLEAFSTIAPKYYRIWIVTINDNIKRCYWDSVDNKPWLTPDRVRVSGIWEVPQPYTSWGLLHDETFARSGIKCPCNTCTGVVDTNYKTRFQLIDFSND